MLGGGAGVANLTPQEAFGVIAAYLNQTCEIARASRDEAGNVTADDFGKITYLTSYVSFCRREEQEATFVTTDGRTVSVSKVYYLPESEFELRAGDKIDGLEVREVRLMTALDGSCRGVKAWVK